MRYVIHSKSERGFWNNTDGWCVNVNDGDIYGEDQLDQYLPLSSGNDAEWLCVDYGD